MRVIESSTLVVYLVLLFTLTVRLVLTTSTVRTVTERDSVSTDPSCNVITKNHLGLSSPTTTLVSLQITVVRDW